MISQSKSSVTLYEDKQIVKSIISDFARTQYIKETILIFDDIPTHEQTWLVTTYWQLTGFLHSHGFVPHQGKKLSKLLLTTPNFERLNEYVYERT